jgi:hypothetical protein
MQRLSTVPAGNGLSCYTANLVEYLTRMRFDGAERTARSVRLAVRPGVGDAPFAFSHHSEPLHDLGAGRWLAYAGVAGPEELSEQLADEIGRHGAVLVLTDRSRLPWAVPEATAAPHYLLVDGRRGGEWHVVDLFTAVLPGGVQQTFEGWILGTGLMTGAAPITPLSPLHRLRNEHAFGFPVALPAETAYQWLTCTDAPPDKSAEQLGDDWITDGREALALLCAFWAGLGEHPQREEQHDDLWAAAQHHVFRYERLLARESLAGPDALRIGVALDAWRQLPQALRFAEVSAARGRARPTLVRLTFEQLAAVELDAESALARHGYVRLSV